MTHPGQVLGPDARAEVAWRISTYSNSGGGSCVETGNLPDHTGRVAVRHSHHPNRLALVLTQPSWAAFVGGVKNSEFDPRR
ncbi:MAG: DUF397 domain-containing protein [Pseudonocardiaceae bacterium]